MELLTFDPSCWRDIGKQVIIIILVGILVFRLLKWAMRI